MQFIYPLFLFALSAIAIPILIHLFNFRKHKTVYFSNLRFIKIIEEQQRKRSRLKNLLILACRILAIIFLVLAFAQPYIPVDEKNKMQFADITSIYIDNSFSMNAEGKNGILLEEAKNKAVKIIDAMPANSRFLIITNDMDYQARHFLNNEQAVNYCTSIKISSAAPGLDKITNLAKQYSISLNNGKQPKVKLFLISDFQKSTSLFQQIVPDSLMTLIPVPVAVQKSPNIYIDTAYFSRPSHHFNQIEQLTAEIINNTGSPLQNLPVQLFINDTLKGISNISVENGTSQKATFKYTNTYKNIYRGRIEISDFPVTFDNTWYFSYTINKTLNINEIGFSKPLPWFKALFSQDSGFRYSFQSVNQINLDILYSSNAIILTNPDLLSSGYISTLEDYLRNGGTVILFPPDTRDLKSMNNMLTTFGMPALEQTDSSGVKLRKINYNHPVFNNAFVKTRRDIELPELKKTHSFSGWHTASTDWLIADIFDRNILIVKKIQKGNLYVFSFPAITQNMSFFAHPLFVPLIYNICLLSQPAQKTDYTAGNDLTVFVPFSGSENQMLYISNNEIELIPGQRSVGNGTLLFINNIQKAGFYFYAKNHTLLGCLALNYNRNESDLSCFSEKEIKDQFEGNNLDFKLLKAKSDTEFVNTLNEMNKGIRLWRWALFCAILCIIFEMLLIKLLKD